MRNLFLAIVTACSLLSINSVTFTGCTTSESVRVRSAESLLSLQIAVHNAMDAYMTQVEAGKVDLMTRIKVRRLYQQWEHHEANAMATLRVMSAIDDPDIMASDDMLQAADTLLKVLIDLAERMNDE